MKKQTVLFCVSMLLGSMCFAQDSLRTLRDHQRHSGALQNTKQPGESVGGVRVPFDGSISVDERQPQYGGDPILQNQPFTYDTTSTTPASRLEEMGTSTTQDIQDDVETSQPDRESAGRSLRSPRRD